MLVPLRTVYAKDTLIVILSGLIVNQLSIDSYHSLFTYFTITIILEKSGKKGGMACPKNLQFNCKSECKLKKQIYLRLDNMIKM